ncbi:MAG: STAS domain-containing protein [Pirellulaceae bacterium]|nr:STAS domain-containing protein [Pirellulaceae bacterium]
MSIYKYFNPEQTETALIARVSTSHFLDRLVIHEFQEELINFVLAEHPQNLIVDFGRVQQISSETVNALIRARECILGHEGTLFLCDLRPEIREVFQLLNLDGTLFQIHDSLSAALIATQ